MKKRMISVWAKRALAVALLLSVIVPASFGSLNNIAEAADDKVPTPLMKLDFEKGFKGESKQTNSEGKVTAENNGFEVIGSDPVLNYECKETAQENNATLYEYNFDAPLYQGAGADADYKKTSTSNTPLVEYDEKMGHVFWMQRQCSVKEYIKTTPAAYTNETTGELLTEVNNELDKKYPPYEKQTDSDGNETAESLKAKEKATLQKDYTYYPEAKMNNPFAKLDLTETVAEGTAPVWTKGITINYWIKLAADPDNASASENTVVLNIKKTGSLQYPANSKLSDVWPTAADSKIPYGFANGFLQISADGSIIFTEDDGTALDQNKNSETYGKNVKFNTENNFNVKGSDKVLTDICKPDEWHMVTIQITNDVIKTYYDGELSSIESEAVSGTAFNNGYGYKGTLTPTETIAADCSKASLLLDWIVSADAVSIGGCNADYTSALGFDAKIAPFYMDDLSFYGEILTTEQLASLYKEGTDKMAGSDIPEPTIIKFETGKEFTTELKSNTPKNDKIASPELTKDSRMGSVLKTYASKATESSSAKLAKNPFAGKKLSGATISYWMKAESKTVDKKGNVSYAATLGVSFVDTAKELYHSKMQENTKYTKASTVLYGMTDGFAVFAEGDTDVNVPKTLKNRYARSLSDEKATEMVEANDGQWHLYTMVLTNKEIKYYIDGVALADESVDKGPRFFDGYYQTNRDILDNNMVYGGSGNYGATALLSFLTYEDTDMYVAYANQSMSSSTYTACSDAYFGEIACYDAALTDTQVAEIYNAQLEKYPESSVTLGDVNADGVINASDALEVLKYAAKLKVLEGDALVAADTTKDGEINASDALAILKKAAGLIKEF